MRRGGGSRGGSFGGGRSGGFGGSRSFRHSRTSRRNHHHRRHYYGPRYYGRPYYRRRGYYGSYYRGETNPAVGIIIIGIIFMIFLPAIAASATTGSTVTIYDLGPGGTAVAKHGSVWKGGVDIDVTGGQVTTFIFDDEPELSRSLPRQENFSGDDIAEGDFEFFTIYLTRGSTITTSWNFTEPISYHLVRGESNFDDWKTGDDTQIYDNFGKTGSHDYEAGTSDAYYFVFWNDGFVTTTMNNVEFDYTLKAHDISTPNSEISGSTYLDPSQVDGNYLVFYNPDTNNEASVTVEVFSRFSWFQVWISVFLVLLIGTIYFAKRASKSFHERQQERSEQAVQQSSKDKSSTDFYQRPQPQHCTSCGSAKLPDAKFCTECGTAF